MQFHTAPVHGINFHSSVDQIDHKIVSLKKCYSINLKFYLFMLNWTYKFRRKDLSLKIKISLCSKQCSFIRLRCGTLSRDEDAVQHSRYTGL